MSFVCNVSIFFSEEHFPFGVQQIFLYQKRDVKVFIVPPGNFFSPTRKLNIVDLNTGYKYIYTLGYTVSKALNKRAAPCRPGLSWREDQCKMSKVKVK